MAVPPIRLGCWKWPDTEAVEEADAMTDAEGVPFTIDPRLGTDRRKASLMDVYYSPLPEPICQTSRLNEFCRMIFSPFQYATTIDTATNRLDTTMDQAKQSVTKIGIALSGTLAPGVTAVGTIDIATSAPKIHSIAAGATIEPVAEEEEERGGMIAEEETIESAAETTEDPG